MSRRRRRYYKSNNRMTLGESIVTMIAFIAVSILFFVMANADSNSNEDIKTFVNIFFVVSMIVEIPITISLIVELISEKRKKADWCNE